MLVLAVTYSVNKAYMGRNTTLGGKMIAHLIDFHFQLRILCFFYNEEYFVLDEKNLRSVSKI